MNALTTLMPSIAVLAGLLAGGAWSVVATPASASEPGSAAERVAGTAPAPLPATVHVFHDQVIHFTPDEPGRYDSAEVTSEDRGRVAVRSIDLPRFDAPRRIWAHVTAHPIPVDEVTVQDKWDRAANVRLRVPGSPDLELLKYITAYGGLTEHRVEVTHLAPLLAGECTIAAFIDTWITPGWTIDFDLEFEPLRQHEELERSTHVLPLSYDDGLTAESLGAKGRTIEVDVPAGAKRWTLYYLVSGHCTDGRGADEFVTKDNLIWLDGEELARFQPWRDDCRQTRAANPYCRRWSDGSWSADFSRSGWCPSDKVLPRLFEIGDLGPGRHSVRIHIEDVRPKDADGNFGYWRVSSYLVGG